MNQVKQGLALLIILGILLIGLFIFGSFAQRLPRSSTGSPPAPRGYTGPSVGLGSSPGITPIPTITNPANLPETFILSGPAENEIIEHPEVNFRFSGAAFGIDVRDLRFETKIEGIDADWVLIYGSDRTIRLPAGPKTYTFLVRTRTPKGDVDFTPASRTFLANLSPFFGKVSFSISGASSDREETRIYNGAYSQEPIEISGWRIRSRQEEVIIPQGAPLFYYGLSNTKEPIRLSQGENAVLYSFTGNPGENLRLNRCVGYLNIYPVNPKFPQNCPRLNRWEIGHLSQRCQDFILNDLRTCQIPNPNEPTLREEPECRQWLQEKLNYNACVRDYQRDLDFYSREWWALLGLNRFFYNRTHDNIRLYDSNGHLVDRRDY